MHYVACSVNSGVAHVAGEEKLAEVAWVAHGEIPAYAPYGLFEPVQEYFDGEPASRPSGPARHKEASPLHGTGLSPCQPVAAVGRSSMTTRVTSGRAVLLAVPVCRHVAALTQALRQQAIAHNRVRPLCCSSRVTVGARPAVARDCTLARAGSCRHSGGAGPDPPTTSLSWIVPDGLWEFARPLIPPSKAPRRGDRDAQGPAGAGTSRSAAPTWPESGPSATASPSSTTGVPSARCYLSITNPPRRHHAGP